MGTLIIPAVADVRGIVFDMAPVVVPDSEMTEVQSTVFLVQRLVLLCSLAQKNGATSEKIFEEMMRGILPNRM